MAKVIQIGTPVNDSEREAIAFLRDNLPAGYFIIHNFELQSNQEFYEIDLAVITPHAVYISDVKGTRGEIQVIGPKWYPEGRQPFTSPLAKLRHHAKVLKGLIISSNPSVPALHKVYVDAAVILTSQDAVLYDSSGRDKGNVVTLKQSLSFFQDSSRIPSNLKDIRPYYEMIRKALHGNIKPADKSLQFGNWTVKEKLGSTVNYTEYRGYNSFAGEKSGTVILRVYNSDPYLSEKERKEELRLISNAYKALSSLPPHPAITGVRDFFSDQNSDKYILVLEDLPGRALKLHIKNPALALTFEQKSCIVKQIMSALSHAHSHNVIHRNISSGSIFAGNDGQARLINFDYARPVTDRNSTIGPVIEDKLEEPYLSPECYQNPSSATSLSDVFSAGIVFYELFTGELPFIDTSEVFSQSAVFQIKPSDVVEGLPGGFDEWLQSLCAFFPEKRPSASKALTEFERLFFILVKPQKEEEKADYSNLPSGYKLSRKYVIEKRLGKPGAFGVVYKVIDTLGDIKRAVKLILKDRHSTLARLEKEYRILLRIPEHRNVVKVIDADILQENQIPFIVFEYIDGLDVDEMIKNKSLTVSDAWDIGLQSAEGLLHLHNNGIYHCDIKPGNLLWTEKGVKIIDFNVSVKISDSETCGGGTRKYIPPDQTLSSEPTTGELQDRDLYALGMTLYQAVTGSYPWPDSLCPPPGRKAPDPRLTKGLEDLTTGVTDLLLKAIAPLRAERFNSTEEFIKALRDVHELRRKDLEVSTEVIDEKENGNPSVNYFLTLYSQSKYSNAGTRGLDKFGKKLYINTSLDRVLAPSVLRGDFTLVIITGNAGDGKTAFLQNLEGYVQKDGGKITFNSAGNGSVFEYKKRRFMVNYDGSQDEGEEKNEDVLLDFFKPFMGHTSSWPQGETRLIAINEGRLVDFLDNNKESFSSLRESVHRGLNGGVSGKELAVVNLNMRSVVANDSDGAGEETILEKLINRFCDEKFWKPCSNCDLYGKCYVIHNIKTFQEQTAGRMVIKRLQELFKLSTLRNRIHITLRDLRSVVSYILVGTSNCKEIHELYASGKKEEIIKRYYFNSSMSVDNVTSDRLLNLLKETDPGKSTDAELDRTLDFIPPDRFKGFLNFDCRPDSYYMKILKRFYDEIQEGYSGREEKRFELHRSYVAALRRLHYFERRDDMWKSMIPYRSADIMIDFIEGRYDKEKLLKDIIKAINTGEGFRDPSILKGNLALKIRDVKKGTVLNYRIFPFEHFGLKVNDKGREARFIEYMPPGLLLTYKEEAELELDLDIFEMLVRLNEGYRANVEELNGFSLSLSVFKNILGSSPYQELLLTETGHDFYRIARLPDGKLKIEHTGSEVT